MKPQVKPVLLVCGVAVAAALISSFAVARRVPTLDARSGLAAPLSAGSPPAAVPSTPSTPVPSTTRPPAEIVLDPGRLDRGPAPAVAYVDERMLIAGYTEARTEDPIIAGVRAGNGLMAIVARTDLYTQLRIFAANGRFLRSVDDVGTLRSSTRGDYTAYATEEFTSNGDPVRGSTLTWVDHARSRSRQLSRPRDYQVRILLIDQYRVVFASRSSPTAAPVLYRWDAATSGRVEQAAGIERPTAVADLGSQVATLDPCTRVISSWSPRTEYWRTCDHRVIAFGPRGRTVLASPADAGDGPAPTSAAVLDNSNGKVLRQWSGVPIVQTGYEDEDNVLLVTEKGSRGAIVRCSISTGRCELATPYVEGVGAQATGNPYRLG